LIFFNDFFDDWLDLCLNKNHLKKLSQNVWVTVSALFLNDFISTRGFFNLFLFFGIIWILFGIFCCWRSHHTLNFSFFLSAERIQWNTCLVYFLLLKRVERCLILIFDQYEIGWKLEIILMCWIIEIWMRVRERVKVKGIHHILVRMIHFRSSRAGLDVFNNYKTLKKDYLKYLQGLQIFLLGFFLFFFIFYKLVSKHMITLSLNQIGFLFTIKTFFTFFFLLL